MQFSPYCWKIQTRKKNKKSNHNNKSDQKLTSLSTSEISKLTQAICFKCKKMQVTTLGLVSVLHLVGWSFPIKPQTKVKRNQSNYPGSLFKLTALWINEISAYRAAVYEDSRLHVLSFSGCKDTRSNQGILWMGGWLSEFYFNK